MISAGKIARSRSRSPKNLPGATVIPSKRIRKRNINTHFQSKIANFKKRSKLCQTCFQTLHKEAENNISCSKCMRKYHQECVLHPQEGSFLCGQCLCKISSHIKCELCLNPLKSGTIVQVLINSQTEKLQKNKKTDTFVKNLTYGNSKNKLTSNDRTNMTFPSNNMSRNDKSTTPELVILESGPELIILEKSIASGKNKNKGKTGDVNLENGNTLNSKNISKNKSDSELVLLEQNPLGNNNSNLLLSNDAQANMEQSIPHAIQLESDNSKSLSKKHKNQIVLAHLACVCANSESTLLRNHSHKNARSELPLFSLNINANNSSKSENIACAICHVSTSIESLVKCEKCFEFAHFNCILQTFYDENPWSALLDLQPSSSSLKVLLSSAKEKFIKEFQSKLEWFLNSKGLKNELVEILNRELENLETGLYRNLRKTEGLLVKTGEKPRVRGFCGKHSAFTSFSCCGRNRKINYFLNKTVKCIGCLREFHRKCVESAAKIDKSNEKTEIQEQSHEIEKGFYCSECESFQLKLKTTTQTTDVFSLDHIPIDSEGLSTCTFPVFLNIMNVHLKKILAFDKKTDFSSLRRVLLASSCFGGLFSAFLSEITLKSLEITCFGEIFKGKNVLRSLELDSVFEKSENLQRNRQIVEFMLSWRKKIPLSGVLKAKIKELQQILRLQEAYLSIARGGKANFNCILSEMPHPEKSYPEFNAIEKDIESFKKRLLAIEVEIVAKEGQLSRALTEISQFLSEKNEDGVFFQDFESFIRKSIGLIRKFMGSLFQEEEIKSYMQQLEGNEQITTRFDFELRKIVSFKQKTQRFSGSPVVIALLFSEFMRSKPMIFTPSLESASENYIRYRLFKKKAEIFLVFDEKFDVFSFSFQNSNRAYEDLYEYIYDVLDLSEIPWVTAGNQRFSLYELLSEDTLEGLINECEALLGKEFQNVFPNEINEIGIGELVFMEEKSNDSEILGEEMKNLEENNKKIEQYNQFLNKNIEEQPKNTTSDIELESKEGLEKQEFQSKNEGFKDLDINAVESNENGHEKSQLKRKKKNFQDNISQNQTQNLKEEDLFPIDQARILEMSKLKEFLLDKRAAALKLSDFLQNFLVRPNKETLEMMSLPDMKALMKKSNIFLSIYEKIFQKKLEKNAAFFQKQLAASSNKTSTTNKQAEAMLIEEYARESSQEIAEILSLDKLNANLLGSLGLHYENYVKFKIEGPEKMILSDFTKLLQFLESLKSLFKEFRELPSLQSFLDFPSFALTFERGFFRLDSPLPVLRKLAENIGSFPLKMLKDPRIREKLLFFRCFLWLKEAETLASQTKPRKLIEVSLLKVGLERLRSDFECSVGEILNGHYVYKEFSEFETGFDEWMSIYKAKILEPLSMGSSMLSLLTSEQYIDFLTSLRKLEIQAKALHLDCDVLCERVKQFETLARASQNTGILLLKAKEGSTICIDQLKVATEFAKNCPLAHLFPYFQQSKETSSFYQNMLQEIVEIKKVFNEKKLRFSKWIVLQLHCRDNNRIFSENVTFSLEFYRDFSRRIKTKKEVEQMIEVLLKNRFNVRNYKELLKQSFQITEGIQDTIVNFLQRNTISKLSYETAMETLSEVVSIRNELIKKPLFLCEEILRFMAFEWGLQAKALLEGLLYYGISGKNEAENLMGSENGNKNNQFLANRLEVWKETVDQMEGMRELLKKQTLEEEVERVEELMEALGGRMGQLEGLREPIKHLKSFQQFLLEKGEEYVEATLTPRPETSAIRTEFLQKRAQFLMKTPDLALISQQILQTRILVSEDCEFLKDLQRKEKELADSLKVITQSVRKTVNKNAVRSLPCDFVINVFKTLYSSPFRVEKGEAFLIKLVNLIRGYRSKLASLETNSSENIALLRMYQNTPVFIPEYEEYLKELQDYEYYRARLKNNGMNLEIEREECGDDVIEIEEEIEDLEFSWEDLEKMDGKLKARGFFRFIEDYQETIAELWKLKLKSIEQISFNHRPKAFFQLTLSELQKLITEGETFNNDDYVKQKMGFLKRFVGKVHAELLKIAKLLLENRENLSTIKENSQFFAKFVDLSPEIQKLSDSTDSELHLFINRCENMGFNKDVLSFFSLNESEKPQIEAVPALPNPPKPVETKNFKTFQSMFTKQVKPPPKRGRPAQKQQQLPLEENKPEEDVNNEEKQQDQDALAIFKTRRLEDQSFTVIEKERNRSVDLLVEYLSQNVYLSPEFNARWVASRLEAQIYKGFSGISEKYRKSMIELMDVLRDLGKDPRLTRELLGDEKRVSFAELMTRKGEIEEGRGRVVEGGNPQEMEEGEEEEEEDIAGVWEKIKSGFGGKEVLLIDEDDEDN